MGRKNTTTYKGQDMRKELHGDKNVTSCSVGMFWTFWDDALVTYLLLGVSVPVRRPGQPGNRTILTTWLTCKVPELVPRTPGSIPWRALLTRPATRAKLCVSGLLCISGPDLVLADWNMPSSLHYESLLPFSSLPIFASVPGVSFFTAQLSSTNK